MIAHKLNLIVNIGLSKRYVRPEKIKTKDPGPSITIHNFEHLQQFFLYGSKIMTQHDSNCSVNFIYGIGTCINT